MALTPPYTALRTAFRGLMAAFFLLGPLSHLLATHNLAGQIAAERTNGPSPNEYRITLTTYTDPAPAGVDRCKADIEVWTTGGNPILITTLRDIPRNNGPVMVNPGDCNLSPIPRNGVVVKATVKRNVYQVIYTFPAPGSYQLRYFDIARHESVVNISNPGDQAFYVETVVAVFPPILGFNNTPILLNEPLYDACAGKLWTDNPGAYDPDGDSLVYRLRPSFQYSSDPTAPVPPMATTGYRFPDDAQFGPGSTFTIDSLTGQITWNTPLQRGIYNIAIIIEEWRDGIFLGYVVRDMAIWVEPCLNNPPVIETITDTCVTAGDVLRFGVAAWDPDLTDSLYVMLNNGNLGNNGPFAVNNPATIQWTIVDPQQGTLPANTLPVRTWNGNNNMIRPDTVYGAFRWQTTCEHIRRQLFQADFFAHDNRNYSLQPQNATLAASKSVRIRVIPPRPGNLTATKTSRQVRLTWTPPLCTDFVVGYNVYRKIGGGYAQDTVCCQGSPLEDGYQLIEFAAGAGNLVYLDSLRDIGGIFGKEICYLVTAVYEEPNPLVQTRLESCATEEACIEIENEPIYLTNDSVRVTSAPAGEIFVSWSQPSIDPFFPPPYTYRIFRANNNAYPAIQVATAGYNDTTFIDQNLNTTIRGYNYRVELYDGTGLFVNTSENTHIGSSIFLIVTGGNNQITLTWNEYVPWRNDRYEVYRSDAGGPFNLIATVPGTGTNGHTYTDNSGLDPNVNYCYFVRSYGSHNVDGVKPLLINDSQVDCSLARDEDAPCPPGIVVVGDCESVNYQITVTKLGLDCDNDADTVTVLFAPRPEGPFVPAFRLAYADFGDDTTLVVPRGANNEFAGCWALQARDTLGNLSEPTEPYCTEFCPLLIMANIFSPNEDGINDVFRPVDFKDVVLREIRIYDRWGRLMHVGTGDIANLWNGTTDFSGANAKEGVYYYHMQYEELAVTGNVPRELTGWVTLVR
jgi:gliding motility-associated-like protein